MVRPKPGDRVKLTWIDITEEPTGSPDKVQPEICHSVGYWVAWKTYDVEGTPDRYALTSDTRVGAEFMGGTALPKGCIVSLEVLK